MNTAAPHCQYAAITTRRDFQVPRLVALLRRRQEMLRAILNPFDGLLQLDSSERNDNFLWIQGAFRAEASADIRRNDTHAPLFPTDMLGKQPANHMRRLGRTPDRQAAIIRIDRRHHAAGLHRMASAAMNLKMLRQHKIGLAENLFHRAKPLMEGRNKIIWSVRMHPRGSGGESRAPVRQGGQLLVFDGDQ